MTPLILSLALLQPAAPPEPHPGPRAFAIDDEVRKVSSRALWPGFDPAKVPLAVFDGEKTFLFRHPHPPPEFRPVANRPETAVVAGQHPGVRANTSIPLGDVRTATLLLDAPEGSRVRDSAAVAIHEAFHVFQAERHPKAGRPCRFTGRESALALDGAKRSVELSRLTREAIRSNFFGRAGWILIVVAGAEPLVPLGFDPLNVERLGPGEVLHSRWVKLGNSAGTLEVLDARAVSESAGKHPLFEGIRRVTVTGLEREPDVQESASGIAFSAAGVQGEFRRARLERKGRTITVHVSKGP